VVLFGDAGGPGFGIGGFAGTSEGTNDSVAAGTDIAINSNNGISGMVSASGRIDGSDLVTIHPNSLLTTAVKYPNWPIYGCLLVSLTILIINKTKLQ